MSILLLFAALHLPVVSGTAFHYHSGVFAQVARARGMTLDWGANGYASVPSCKYVDPRHPWYVSATVAGRPVRLQILDCSNPRDLPRQRARGLVLETDWWLAHQQGWATYSGDAGPGRARAQIWGYSQRR